MPLDDRIDNGLCRTDRVELTCVNHPHLRWSTKNISHVGARTITFKGDASRPSYRRFPFPIIPEGQETVKLYDNNEREYTKDEAEYELMLDGWVFECDCSIRDLKVLYSPGHHTQEV